MKFEHGDFIIDCICALGLAMAIVVFANIVWMLLGVVWGLITA